MLFLFHHSQKKNLGLVAEGSTQQNDQHETQVGKLFGSKFIDPLSMLGS